jgi:hypothetical protein
LLDERSGFIADTPDDVVLSDHEKNVNASRLFAPDFLRVPVRHAGAAAQGVAACLAAVALLVFCPYARRRWIAISKEGGKV